MLTHTTLYSRSSEFDSLIRKSVFTNLKRVERSEDQGIFEALQIIQNSYHEKGVVYLIGNGGSAAIASHVAADFCTISGLRVQTLHDAATLTCFSNDFGYENAFATMLERMANPCDCLIAISSSGQSSNIINSVCSATALGMKTITLTGFLYDNPLRELGHLNYWVDCDEYGMVEVAHLFTLHYLSERMSLELPE